MGLNHLGFLDGLVASVVEEAEEAEEVVAAVEAVQEAARPPPREGDGATLGGGNEEWQ